MKKKDVYAALPTIVKTTLLISEGWLVGGALHNIAEGTEPKDWDIVVPYHRWQDTVNSLKNTGHKPELNSFGGFKYSFFVYDHNECLAGAISIDLWPQELREFITNTSRLGYIYNLKKSILLREL